MEPVHEFWESYYLCWPSWPAAIAAVVAARLARLASTARSSIRRVTRSPRVIGYPPQLSGTVVDGLVRGCRGYRAGRNAERTVQERHSRTKRLLHSF